MRRVVLSLPATPGTRLCGVLCAAAHRCSTYTATLTCNGKHAGTWPGGGLRRTPPSLAGRRLGQQPGGSAEGARGHSKTSSPGGGRRMVSGAPTVEEKKNAFFGGR